MNARMVSTTVNLPLAQAEALKAAAAHLGVPAAIIVREAIELALRRIAVGAVKPLRTALADDAPPA